MIKRFAVPVIVVAAAFTFGCGASKSPSADPTADTTLTQIPTPASATSQPPVVAPVAVPTVPDGSIVGDGTFVVPDEVKPGTYRTTVPDGMSCYYVRLKSTSGELGSIIASGAGRGGDRKIIEIRAGDKFFETLDCGTWRKA